MEQSQTFGAKKLHDPQLCSIEAMSCLVPFLVVCIQSGWVLAFAEYNYSHALIWQLLHPDSAIANL